VQPVYLSLDALSSLFGHFIRVTWQAKRFDLRDARSAIRSENESENLGHEIIEHLAVHGIWEFSAIRARRVMMFRATNSDLAPRGLLIFMTAWALFRKIRFAGSAVEPAIRNELRVR
jgi:hypothetical protein